MWAATTPVTYWGSSILPNPVLTFSAVWKPEMWMNWMSGNWGATASTAGP